MACLIDRDLDQAERDYLDVLSDLVEKYEQENHPIVPASDAAMIRYLLDLRKLARSSWPVERVLRNRPSRRFCPAGTIEPPSHWHSR